MDKEFHYYITGILAHKSGFSEEESSIIAYSSQLVDDNTNIFTITDNTGNEYSNYISQTRNILKPRKTLTRIYPIFHFIPGDPMAETARRKDGKMHILNTTPNSKLSKLIMYKAFNSDLERRLYRIGIASHSFTDAWAHQNFIGFTDSFNGFDMNPLPNVGHSDVLFNPDRVGRSWTDHRLVNGEVENNERFILAAESLFYEYTNYLELKLEWRPIKEVLLAVMGLDSQNKRLTLYSTIVPWLLPYNKYYWFDKAINQDVRGLRDSRYEVLSSFTVFKDEYLWKDGIEKENTHWFKFQESVKDHQEEVLPDVNTIFKLMGVDIKLF